jgi:hypothetical protein
VSRAGDTKVAGRAGTTAPMLPSTERPGLVRIATFWGFVRLRTPGEGFEKVFSFLIQQLTPLNNLACLLLLYFHTFSLANKLQAVPAAQHPLQPEQPG